MQDIIRKVEKAHLVEGLTDFSPGDTVEVTMRIREGDKERNQPFRGTVIEKRGSGLNRTFTVRKSSGNVYVERIFPLNSPLISGIKLVRRGRVRRAKLSYLRGRRGKSTRVKERK
jgi:large subunit ribosomal protein L19